MPLDIQITRTLSIIFLTFESALTFQKGKKKMQRKREINSIHTDSRTCQMSELNSDISGNNFQHT